MESVYRQYYNVLRVSESKAWSTPVFHGELAAYRRSLLEEIGGFPVDLGADDSHTATLIALKGYRAITPETLECVELVPAKGYHGWRVRRAQHLVQHFARALRLWRRAPKQYRWILLVEAYLHLLNPWLLAAATALLALAALENPPTTLLLATATLLLAYKPYRTWITTQAYLIAATIKNIWTKEIVWEKQEKKNPQQNNTQQHPTTRLNRDIRG